MWSNGNIIIASYDQVFQNKLLCSVKTMENI
jgi:hypothetical protein